MRGNTSIGVNVLIRMDTLIRMSPSMSWNLFPLYHVRVAKRMGHQVRRESGLCSYSRRAEAIHLVSKGATVIQHACEFRSNGVTLGFWLLQTLYIHANTFLDSGIVRLE